MKSFHQTAMRAPDSRGKWHLAVGSNGTSCGLWGMFDDWEVKDLVDMEHKDICGSCLRSEHIEVHPDMPGVVLVARGSAQ